MNMAAARDDDFQVVKAQAEGIARGIVQEWDAIQAVLDAEGEEACLELNEAWEEAAMDTEPEFTRHRCGKLEYEVGLAGPHMGRTNIWLEGEIERRDDGDWPKTVALCFWAGFQKGTVELEREGPFHDFVYLAIGCSDLDAMLEWFRVPTTECANDRHDWMGNSKRWYGHESNCRHCDASWWL